MITALDVINDEQHLPVSHIAHDRKWRKSQVSPMGGRIVLELLSCERSESQDEHAKSQDEEHAKSPQQQRPPTKFVRLNINDGITALPDCHSGPGRSCPLSQFLARTRQKGELAGRFVELCGLDQGAAERIVFLRQ